MKKLTICLLLLTPALYGMKRKAELATFKV
jgi:hypothetical protein